MTEYDDMVNESGRIDDSYFEEWLDQIDKQNKEYFLGDYDDRENTLPQSV